MAAVDIDSVGDILLEVGKHRFRVSSNVLSLASPVFSAIFHSGFSEDIEPDVCVDNPKTIPLPGDDPKAVEFFCRLVHLQLNTVPREPKVEELETLAVFCDKYQATESMLFCCTLWVNQLALNATSQTLSRLLPIADLLDLPHCFAKVSNLLILQHEGSFRDLPGLQDNPLLRRDFAGERSCHEYSHESIQLTHVDDLATTQRTFNYEFERVMLRPVFQLTEHDCTPCQQNAGLYLHWLRKKKGIHDLSHNAWYFPTDLKALQSTLADMTTELKGWNHGNSHERCRRATPESLRTETLKYLNELRTSELMLCLDCIRTDRRSRITSQCRMSHKAR